MSSHEHSISPLRQRMIEDMTLRKLSPKTQSGYLRWVKRLNGFLKRSPATATAEDLRRFQLDLVERGVSVITVIEGAVFKETEGARSRRPFDPPASVLA